MPTSRRCAEGAVRRRGCCTKPFREIAHERRNLRRGRKAVASVIGQHETALIGIASGDLGSGAQHHEAMQVAHVHFRQRIRLLPRKLAHVMQCLEVIDGFEVVLERLAADGDALLDNKRRLDGGEGVPLDGVRCVGEFEVLAVFEVGQPAGGGRPQPVKLGLLLRDALQKVVHGSPNPGSICNGFPHKKALCFQLSNFVASFQSFAQGELPDV